MRTPGFLVAVLATFLDLQVLPAIGQSSLCVYWAHGVDTKPRLDAAGITPHLRGSGAG